MTPRDRLNILAIHGVLIAITVASLAFIYWKVTQ